jgi:hypothetical protein
MQPNAPLIGQNFIVAKKVGVTGELELSRFFTPSSLELGESAYKWREAGFIVLAIEPCPMSSLKRGF